MAVRSTRTCIEDLRNRGYNGLATNVEVLTVAMEASVSLANRFFPSAIEGSLDQATIALQLLEYVTHEGGGEDPPEPTEAELEAALASPTSGEAAQ